MDFNIGSALALALSWLDLVKLGGYAAIPGGRPSRQFLRLFLTRTDGCVRSIHFPSICLSYVVQCRTNTRAQQERWHSALTCFRVTVLA